MDSFKQRIIGFDIARAFAILGMVIVNYKIAMNAEGNGSQWLIALTGMLEGRAAAVFVVITGVGLSLITNKARASGDQALLRSQRRTIGKRAVFLFGLGMLLFLLEWEADILHYYGLYLFLASFYIAASSKALILSAAVLLASAQPLQILFDYTRGWDASFLNYDSFWTIEGFIRNLLLNGFHPIIPWFCLFLVGMWLGRLDFSNPAIRMRLFVASSMIAATVELLSYALVRLTRDSIGQDIAYFLFTTKPMPPTLFYMVSGASTAIAFIILCIYLSERLRAYAATAALAYMGQLALTHYVGHYVVLLVLSLFNGLDGTSLMIATLMAIGFFIASLLGSYWWRKRFSRGPIELIMRKLSG